jgi:hypothetical protein
VVAGFYIINGERVPALDIDDLTLDESAQLQQMAGDKPLGEIIALIGQGDVNVTRGMMIFSILHHTPGAEFASVERRVGALKWRDFEHELPKKATGDEDEAAPDPPTLLPVDTGTPPSASASA